MSQTTPTSGKDELRAKIRHVLGYCSYTPDGEICMHMPTNHDDELEIDQIMQLIEDTCLEIIGEHVPHQYYCDLTLQNQEHWVNAEDIGCSCSTEDVNKMKDEQRAILARKLGKKGDV